MDSVVNQYWKAVVETPDFRRPGWWKGTADCKSLATSKLNSGKPQLTYHIWIWSSFLPQHALPLGSNPVNQLWFSTVQLACCKTFTIRCIISSVHCLIRTLQDETYTAWLHSLFLSKLMEFVCFHKAYRRADRRKSNLQEKGGKGTWGEITCIAEQIKFLLLPLLAIYTTLLMVYLWVFIDESLYIHSPVWFRSVVPKTHQAGGGCEW